MRALAALLITATIAGATGCSLKDPDRARIRIDVPARASRIGVFNAGSVGGQTSPSPSPLPPGFDGDPNARPSGLPSGTPTGDEGESAFEPQTLDDFNCYAVNVSAPDLAQDPNIPGSGLRSCSDDYPAPTKLWGMVDATSGGVLEGQVPTGSDRTFQVIGLRIEGGCPSMDQLIRGGVHVETKGGYELGRTTTDIQGDTSVDVHVEFDPFNPKRALCHEHMEGPRLDRLAIFGAPQMSVGTCMPFQFALEDASGRAIGTSSEVTVNFSLSSSVNSSTAQVYADGSCQDPVTSITTRNAFTMFFVKSTTVEDLSIVASSDGLLNGNFNIPVTRLFLRWDPIGTVPTGACVPMNLRVTDANGFLVNPPSGFSASLSGNTTGGLYYDSTCAAITNIVSFGTGQHTATLYYKDGASETTNLVASSIDYEDALTSVTTIVPNPGEPYRLAIVAMPTGTVPLDDPFDINVGILDKDDALATSGDRDVNLIAYSDPSCNAALFGFAAPSSGGLAEFHGLLVSQPGMLYFRAFAPGVPIGQTSCEGINFVTPPPPPGTANKMVITATGNGMIDPNVCHPFTISTFDVLNNSAPFEASTSVTITGNYFTVFQDSGCLVPDNVVDYPQGLTGKVFYVVGLAYGLTSVDGQSGIPDRPVTSYTGRFGPHKIQIDGPASVGEGNCLPFTVTAVDDSNSPVNAVGAGDLPFEFAGSNSLAYRDSDCTIGTGAEHIVEGDSSMTFYARSTAAGAFQLDTISSPVPSAGIFSGNTGPGGEDWVLSPGTTLNPGCNQLTVSITPYNTQAQLIAHLQSDLHLEFYSNSGCTIATTTAVIPKYGVQGYFYVKDAFAETVTVTVNGSGLTSTQQIYVTTLPAPAKLAYLSPPGSFNGNGCAVLTVQSRDSSDNPINVTSNTTVTLSAANHGQFFSNDTCTTAISQVTINSGQDSAFFYVSDPFHEIETFTASDGSLTDAVLTAPVRAWYFQTGTSSGTVPSGVTHAGGMPTFAHGAAYGASPPGIWVASHFIDTGVDSWWAARFSLDGSSSSDEDHFGLNGGSPAQAKAVAVDPVTGDVYVAGFAVDVTGFKHWIVRKRVSGTWSNSDDFQLDASHDSEATGITIASDGTVIVVGKAKDAAGYDHWFTRKLSGGVWGTTRDFQYVAGRPAEATAVACDGLGSCVVAGEAWDSSWISHWMVYSSNDDGDTWGLLDDIHPANLDNRPTAVAMLNGTDVYVTGVVFDNAAPRHSIVRRYNRGNSTWSDVEDFQHDSGYNTDATGVFFLGGGYPLVFGTAMDPTDNVNRWFVRGYFTSPASYFDDFLLDLSGTKYHSQPTAALILPDGTYTVVGNCDSPSGPQICMRQF